jgi:hypothetical protein
VRPTFVGCTGVRLVQQGMILTTISTTQILTASVHPRKHMRKNCVLLWGNEFVHSISFEVPPPVSISKLEQSIN